mmetsp:Transcript_61200/g.154512  ORF Transcript_61200/g.154512 Transcript_61200/m.154512 type:complete len:85 (-) Transcript_61200:2213-2467(-)
MTGESRVDALQVQPRTRRSSMPLPTTTIVPLSPECADALELTYDAAEEPPQLDTKVDTDERVVRSELLLHGKSKCNGGSERLRR